MAQLIQRSLSNLWIPSLNLGLKFCSLTAYRQDDHPLSSYKISKPFGFGFGRFCHLWSSPCTPISKARVLNNE
jgi:hypothetical protein